MDCNCVDSPATIVESISYRAKRLIGSLGRMSLGILDWSRALVWALVES